ncbi:MAG: type II secretion system F family protein [Candidatus Nanopelagicaceae bacterium]
MMSNIELIYPFIMGCLTFLLIFIIGRFSQKTYRNFKLRTERLSLLFKYKIASPSFESPSRKRTSAARIVLNEFGNRFVRNRYKVELEKLIVSSGEAESKTLDNLIEQKSIFAFGGLFLTFGFVAIKNQSFLPITIALIFFGYLYPNVESFVKRLRGTKYRSKLEFMLAQSGVNNEEEYLSFIKKKIVYAFFGFILSYVYLLGKDGNFSGFSVSLLAVFLGFFLPDILLQNKVLKRKEELANTLPDAIDMLQMCVNAGLAFPAALTKISETQSGAISEEFSRVTAEVQLGKSRQEALLAMAERTREPNIHKFVNSMAQVERFGIPIGNVLTEQSKEMRAKRRESARESAQKVPVKILAPIMLCFLPTVLIVVLGPAVVMLVKTLG